MGSVMKIDLEGLDQGRLVTIVLGITVWIEELEEFLVEIRVITV
jgi:hypothetical protein